LKLPKCRPWHSDLESAACADRAACPCAASARGVKVNKRFDHPRARLGERRRLVRIGAKALFT